MLTWFRADLHVHTCLSPCGDLAMSPRKIVAEAVRQKIDIVAVTDHNSAENARAVMRAAVGVNMAVLPGLEVCTKEEVHVLGIFDSLEAATGLQSVILERLDGMNDPEAFGLQVLANEMDEVEGFQEKLLIGATDLAVDEIVRKIHSFNGLAIASHIDRESFSVIGQLGFIPPGLRFDALEISGAMSLKAARERYPEYRDYAFVMNSDAHFLDELGNRTTWFLLREPTCDEIRRAIRHEDGRRVSAGPGPPVYD